MAASARKRPAAASRKPAAKAKTAAKRARTAKGVSPQKKTVKKQSPGEKKKQTGEQTGFPLMKEIVVIAALAISVLIFISCFGDDTSALNWMKQGIFLAFGNISYFIPFVLFFTVCFVISNEGDKRVYGKLAGGGICLFAVCGVGQMIFPHEAGGGFLGILLISLMKPYLGGLGSYVVTIGLFVIGIVIITERSVITLIGRHSKKAYGTVKSNAAVHREKKAVQAEEKAVLRQQRLEELEQKKKELESQRGELQKKTGEKANGKKRKISIPIKGIGDTLLGSERPDREPILKDQEGKEISELFGKAFTGKICYSDAESKNKKLESDGLAEEQFPEMTDIPDFKTDNELWGLKRHSSDEALREREVPISEQQAENDSRTVVTASGKVITVELDNIPGAKPVSEPIEGKEQQEENVITPVLYTEPKKYIFPSLSLMKKGRKPAAFQRAKEQELRNTALKLQQTLQNFGVGVAVTNISCGPAVTRYELQPEQGVKVSKIVSLTDDIKLNLAAADIRMEAPIPGKAAIGIEVPNKENQTVLLRDLLESQEFRSHPSKIAFAAGRNIAGSPVVADIARMPHLLIAGATGSGKSVCINTLIMSILYKAKPSEVKLIMIDPKVVELSVYNGIPHLLIPVVTDPKKAAGALNWAVAEMNDRYQKFAEYNVRDRQGYNEKAEALPTINGEEKPQKLPQIVIIVDELADLMMVAPSDVEDAICRLAQMARAAGIHLVIATQRPSVNVVTGLIKANVPSRIAFSVSSGVDSRTIIDMNGAEKLLGKGDMLFYPSGYQKPDRVQGAFVSDAEVASVVEFLSKQTNVEGAGQNPSLDQTISGVGSTGNVSMERDEYFVQAGRFVIEKERASIGMLQRMFKIGFNRAARIVDQLAQAGVVGEEEGTKPRKILMTIEEFEAFIQKIGE